MPTPTPTPDKPSDGNPTHEQINKAKARIDDLAAQAMKRAGEKGFNPFLWTRSVLSHIDYTTLEGFKTAMSVELPKSMVDEGVKEVDGPKLKVPVPKS